MAAEYRTLKGFTGDTLTVLYTANGRTTNKYPEGGYAVTYTDVVRDSSGAHGTHPKGHRVFLGGNASKHWVVTDGDASAPEQAPTAAPKAARPVTETPKREVPPMVRMLEDAAESGFGFTYTNKWGTAFGYDTVQTEAANAVDCGLATLDGLKLRITDLGRDYLKVHRQHAS